MRATLAWLLCLTLAAGADPARSKARRLVEEGKRLQYGLPKLGLFPTPKLDDEARQKAALARFNEAIKICPTYGQAYAERGQILLFERHGGGARADAWKALKWGAEDIDFVVLASAFEGREARNYLRQAAARCQDKDIRKLLERLRIKTYLRDGQTARYLKEMEQLCAQTRDSMDYYALGEGYELCNQARQAEAAYRQALESVPMFRLVDVVKPSQMAEKVWWCRLRQNDLSGAEVVLAQMQDRLEPRMVPVYRGFLGVLSGRKVPAARQLAEGMTGDDVQGGGSFVQAVLFHAGGDSGPLSLYPIHSKNPWECAQARRLLKGRPK